MFNSRRENYDEINDSFLARNWKNEQVLDWLKEKEVSEDVIKIFKDNQINGITLLKLNDKDLKEDLGISNGIIRKTILEGAKDEKRKDEKHIQLKKNSESESKSQSFSKNVDKLSKNVNSVNNLLSNVSYLTNKLKKF
jgi:uncharacterized membrane protein